MLDHDPRSVIIMEQIKQKVQIMAEMKLMCSRSTVFGIGRNYYILALLLGILHIISFSVVHVSVEGAAAPRPRPSTVGLGKTFASNDYLMQSQNEAFQLDFRQWVLDSGVSQCMAGVRYTYKTPTAIIWSFNTDQNLPWNATTCSLELTLEGDFLANITLDNGTNTIAWHTDTAGLGVQNLTLQDDGNLVLVDRSGNIVWQSFGYFKDLFFIPSGMKFFKNNTLHSRIALAGYTDYTAPGKFAMRIGSVQDLILFTTDNQFVYYSFGPPSTSSNTAVLDYIIITQYLNFYSNSLSLFGSIQPHNSSITVPNGTDLIGSGMILSDGNFMINYLNFSTARHIWYYNSSMSSFCDYPDHCGDYGLCDPKKGECSCPPGFKKKTSTDTNCTVSDSSYSFQPISVSFRKQFVAIKVSSQTDCRDKCSQNTSCNAALFDANTSTCAQYPILHTIAQDADKTTGQIMFLRVEPPQSSKSINIGVIVGTTVSALVIIMVLLTALLYWHRHRLRLAHLHSGTEEKFLLGLERLPPRFSYKDLQVATKEFSKKLGVGGSGSVYEGELHIAGIPTKVAVKKLESLSPESGNSTDQFKAEVATIGNVSHVNLVKLKGFCMEGPSRLLVYEFMTRGSLDRWLFKNPTQASSGNESTSSSKEGISKHGSVKHSGSKDPRDIHADAGKTNELIILDWDTRCRIALHTARALDYLHHQSADHIVHCDIKPQNILLDDKFNAKVADFGLAKLMGADKESFTLTTLKGTRGYLAPEWLDGTSITTKTDVYSYGVVLLNLITGRRSIDSDYGHLPSWTLKAVHQTKSSSKKHIDIDAPSCTSLKTDDNEVSVMHLRDMLLDECLQEYKDNVSLYSFECMLSLAIACIHRDPSERPSMASVVQSLETIFGVNSSSTINLQRIPSNSSVFTDDPLLPSVDDTTGTNTPWISISTSPSVWATQIPPGR